MKTTKSNSEEVLISLRQIIRSIDLYSKNLIQHHHLTVPQLLVLKDLKAVQFTTSKELSKRISLSQGTLTPILDKLEKRSLISRKRSEQDKRKVVISLTEEGTSVEASSPQLLQESFVKRYESLEEWEQTLILSSLQRLSAMMNAEDIDASPVLVVS